MKTVEHKVSPESKAAKVFKKLAEDKKRMHEHLRNGGTMAELKKQGYKFARPV